MAPAKGKTIDARAIVQIISMKIDVLGTCIAEDKNRGNHIRKNCGDQFKSREMENLATQQ
jgi:hypothetical protein